MEISGFKDIICIDGFFYRLQINTHETCRFSVLLSEENVSNCMAQLGKSCTVEDDVFRFSGTVTSVSVKRGMDWCRVEAVVQGGTLRLDREERCRVFQSAEKNISDILKKMGVSEISCCNEDGREIQEVLVQEHETDWQFLKRLAAYTGTYLFPGEKAWIGGPLKAVESLENEEILELRVELDHKRGSAVCQTTKRLKIGTRVQFYGKDFFVDGVTYRKCREEYLFEYHLLEDTAAPEPAGLPAHLLPARVTDNADPEKRGRVRLEFTEPYEDVMAEDGIWVECATPWASEGLGVACVPWKDDVVEVRVYNGEACVSHARRKTAFDSRFQEADSRYLFAGEHTWMMLNDEKIMVDNSKYRCTITDDKFTLCFGDKLTVSMEEGKLTLHADTTDLEVSGGTKLVTQGFEMDGKNKAAITASTVEIKGKSGVSIN